MSLYDDARKAIYALDDKRAKRLSIEIAKRAIPHFERSFPSETRVRESLTAGGEPLQWAEVKDLFPFAHRFFSAESAARAAVRARATGCRGCEDWTPQDTAAEVADYAAEAAGSAAHAAVYGIAMDAIRNARTASDDALRKCVVNAASTDAALVEAAGIVRDHAATVSEINKLPTGAAKKAAKEIEIITIIAMTMAIATEE